MLARWGIRLGTSLAAIALGFVVSAALLEGFSADLTEYLGATLLFWIVNLVVNFIAVRVLIRTPSVALAGMLALASTIVSLIIIDIVISGIRIRGVSTYLLATLIIWIATVVGDVVARRMLRARRAERRD